MRELGNAAYPRCKKLFEQLFFQLGASGNLQRSISEPS